MQKSSPRCDLLLRDAILNLEQVTIHLNQAASHLRQCQKNSIELRFKSYWRKRYQNRKQPQFAISSVLSNADSCVATYKMWWNQQYQKDTRALWFLEQSEHLMRFRQVLATINAEDRPSNVTYFDTTGARYELLQHPHAKKEPYTKHSLSRAFPKTQRH